tara:strand:+ start:853 stop:1494 length:642 start_codon:yes stop_codon:yes gene_type:complete
MAKKFNIHDWQQKHLFEQDDFTPDLEDDDLKRSKIQQMMNTEKGLQKDDYKLVNSISNVAEMYSYGEILDALESFYIKNDEQQSAEMVRKHAKEFRDFLGPDDDDELEEMNTTGTGASFSAGNSPAYATPKAFGKKKDKDIEVLGYKKVNEQEEEEEPMSRDVERLEKLINDTINTQEEWKDMFQLLMAHSEEVTGLNDAQIKSLLQQSLKEL